MTRDEIMRNKIYRAVHDGVCPSCGGDFHVNWQPCRCGFNITHRELMACRDGVKAWGADMQAYMAEWRAESSTSKETS